MASIAQCIEKLVVAGTVTRKTADEALGMYERSKAEYSTETGPAGADAAAALEVAKKLRDRAAERQISIAASVKTFQVAEQRVLEHPYGRAAALNGIMTKDPFRGGKLVRDLPADNPVKSGNNVDYLHQTISGKLFTMLGAEMEAFRPGFLASKDIINSAKNFVYERFGVNTGDGAAKTVSYGFGKAIDYAAARAKRAGKVFNELEDWRLMQPWTPERVGQFSEDEFLRDFRAEIASGGVKLFDQDTGRFATAARYDDMLKKAYSDIKTEGGSAAPFSKQMRTFQFQPGQTGADSWLKLQAKYGMGNEIMGAVTRHIDHMARDIALTEIMGPNPSATFAALIRRVKEDPSIPTGAGAERFNPVRAMQWTQSDNVLRNTFKVISGQAGPVASETFARVMAGARDLIGVSSLRNLPITIIPGDTAMTLLASNHMGMSGFKILSEVFDGTTSKEAAAHLQIASHGYMDYINNAVRKYEDEINVSGLVRKVSRTVVKATGAELWTTNGRRGFQTSVMNQIAEMRDRPFDKLDPAFRSFFDSYGFTPADWDKMRTAAPVQVGNGAKYYLNPDNIEPALYERLLSATKEQGSYAFHQPDARTRAIAGGGVTRGTASGELWLSAMQYKQFALERMTTHLMRIMVDGPAENRIMRGIAFTALSMAAGAVSLQAAQVLAGKDPMEMGSPGFWVKAFTRGGAGGVYGDILSAGLRGDRSGADVMAELAGPIPGFAADTARLAFAPLRHELDDTGRQTFGQEALGMGKRLSPNTWYTKLAVDRLLWDKLQILIDPNYRGSFRRAEQNARKQGAGFWFAPGDTGPQRAPDLGTALGRP
jgi:hypothetical protein